MAVRDYFRAHQHEDDDAEAITGQAGIQQQAELIEYEDANQAPSTPEMDVDPSAPASSASAPNFFLHKQQSQLDFQLFDLESMTQNMLNQVIKNVCT